MKIKTYEATTEQEAIEKVKNELGSSAIILTIKKITPKGIFKLFRKPKVEVTAAQDDGMTKAAEPETKKAPEKPPEQKFSTGSSDNLIKDVKISEQEVKIKTLEQMLSNNEAQLKKIVSQLTATVQATNTPDEGRKFDNEMLQLFYQTLIKNGVKAELAFSLLSDLDTYFDDDSTNINMLVKLVYNRIIQKLGEPQPIKLKEGILNLVVFMGPTGVGKTTTIAKLASNLILQEKKRVGLVTADTYRIAAVEQLRTYGEILGINVEVVYKPDELEARINRIKNQYDVIFLDTAGRSHKNKENLEELKHFLSKVPDAELYLVLSLTTKYEDLLNISKVYGTLGDYSIILTKLDETGEIGNALNICIETGKRLSYITDGQNVPEDIKAAEPTYIARALLGSYEDNGPSK